MKNIFSFIKKSWPYALIFVLAFLLLGKNSSRQSSQIDQSVSYQKNYLSKETGSSAPLPAIGGGGDSSAPNERMVVQNSWLSILVKSVKETQKSVIQKAEKLGGFMIDSSIESPEGLDKGNLTVRVPAKNLNEFLEFLRKVGVRTVSENLTGYDITDQFTDIQSRIATLEKTKAKFEEIMTKALTVEEILTVQREIINLQEQIDSYKGQEEFLKKSSETAKVTVYLASDELSLPYQPETPWKPAVIFKKAVRSLIKTLRFFGTIGIWLGVYSVVLVPGYLIFRFIKGRRIKKQ